jgi:hypothetical protein
MLDMFAVGRLPQALLSLGFIITFDGLCGVKYLRYEKPYISVKDRVQFQF